MRNTRGAGHPGRRQLPEGESDQVECLRGLGNAAENNTLDG